MKNRYNSTKSIVVFIQILSRKTEMELNSKAIVAYSLHVILLCLSARKGPCSIANGHTLLGFSTVCSTQKQQGEQGIEKNERTSVRRSTSSKTGPFESGVRSTTDAVEREQKLIVYYVVLKLGMVALQKCQLQGFVIMSRELVDWRRVLVPVSNCSHILRPETYQPFDTLLR